STKTFTMATSGTGVFQVDTAATNLTLSGTIGGSGALTKAGAGTLTLSVANTYSGGTTLSAGIFQVGNNNALGSGTATLTSGTLSSDSATARTLSNALLINGNIGLGQTSGGTGALTFTGNADLGGGTRTLTVNVADTMSGIISNG